MTFRELDLKASYETLNEDPLDDFYLPVLERSVSYDRICGYFCSTSLALAARGIAGLVANGGKMRLIVSPRLSPEDARELRLSSEDPQGYVERIMLGELDDLGQTLADDHVRALGWMLAKGMLEMRIACVVDDVDDDTGALFHQKVGLMRDREGNALSFSGSINETASGWLRNAEEFKVFCEWDGSQRTYFQSDRAKFDAYWEGRRPYVRVYEPSDAFKERVVRLADDFDMDRLTLKNYVAERRREQARERISLFDYQEQAVRAWEGHGRRLLFEMATGTGKTRTAIACVNVAKADSERFACVVAAPEVTLVRQWKKELDALGVIFDDTVFADGSSGGRKVWEAAIRRALSRIACGMSHDLLVLTTHVTASSDAFTRLFEGLDEHVDLCFVGDEVHGLGARQRRHALLERYEMRIGLSATPARWFDGLGTRLLVDFFGGDSFVFDIAAAQNTINPLTGRAFLAPYRYELIYVTLDDAEMQDYVEISKRIARMYFAEADEESEVLSRLLAKRADIAKCAREKLVLFEDYIAHAGYVENTLVFTSPQQIDDVCRILARRRVCAHPFTQREGTRRTREFGGKSEREYLIDEFRAGGYQALVAIRCLDEGIDIPEARCAILLSSSTNPREYIQRIGRVIRSCEGKEEATIVDFVVEPNWSRIDDPETFRYERRMFERELGRVRDMARNATNGIDIVLAIGKKLEGLYGI